MAIRNALLLGIDYQDTGSTTLNGALNNSATSISVAATASFKSGGGIIKVDSEYITYTGVSGGNTFTGCTRGTYGSSAASHSNGATVSEKEIVKAVDLKDTFDAAANYLKTLSMFWLNSYLYDVYDDFESYSTGAFTSNANWTVTLSEAGAATAAATVESSTNAGGTGKELKLTCTVEDDLGDETAYAEVKSLLNPASSHLWFRAYWVLSSASAPTSTNTYSCMQVKLEGQAYTDVATTTFTGTGNSSSQGYVDIFLHCTAANTFDMYIGGKKIYSGVTAAAPYVYVRAYCVAPDNNNTRTITATVYIDDVRTAQNPIQ